MHARAVNHPSKTRAISKPKRGFSALPFLGDLVVFWRLLWDREAHWGLKLVAFATLAYVVSPVDAFPEAVAPLVGYIDDLGLVIAIRLLLERPLSKYRYPLFAKRPEPSPDRVIEAELV